MKIAKTGIKRNDELMYYIKGGDVWAVPRKKPGQPKGKAVKVAAPGIEMDYSRYLYFLDSDGDVACKERKIGGSATRRSLEANEDDLQELSNRRSLFPEVPCSLTRSVHPGEHCLRVDDYARAMSAVLNVSFGEFCFAIYGHWGRGKTFLMQRLSATLPRTYCTVWFSAWKYRTTPEAWIYLYETLVRASRRDGTLSTISRAVRAHMSKHGVWSIIVLILSLSATILGLGLVPVLIGILGLIGLLKAYAVFQWSKKLPRSVLSLPQHADKLGLQAVIGDDLTALLKGWIPDARHSASGPGETALPSRQWLFPYFLSIAAVAAASSAALQGHEYFLLPIHPPDEVRWIAVVAIIAFGIALPFWMVYCGRGTERIALVVDDLDRCSPTTMLDIIESLKLLLEDPDISSRVQVLMLVEEESLHHAIEKRYEHIKARGSHPGYSPGRNVNGREVPRVVSETVEKLFLAHLRLRELSRRELTEVMSTYIRRYELGDRDTRPPQLTSEAFLTNVDESPNAAAVGKGSIELTFTVEERKALVDAVDQLSDPSIGRFFGPRSIRTFLTRYQLAKFLLATRKATCSPHELVKRLVNPGISSPTPSDLDDVVAEVS